MGLLKRLILAAVIILVIILVIYALMTGWLAMPLPGS